MFSIEHVPIEKKYHLNNELHKGDYIPTNRLNMKIGQKIMWSNMHLHIFCCLKFFHTFEINPLNEINAFISLIPLLFFTCGYFFWYNTICLVEAKGKGLDPNCSHHIFVSVPSKRFNLYQIKWVWLSSFGVLKFDASKKSYSYWTLFYLYSKYNYIENVLRNTKQLSGTKKSEVLI